MLLNDFLQFTAIGLTCSQIKMVSGALYKESLRPWTEEPGRLQSVRPQTVRHNLAIEHAHMPRVLEIKTKQMGPS